MIKFNCKYTPVELLSVFEKCELLNNNAEQFDYSQTVMHPNICSHIKAVLEDIHSSSYDKAFLMSCCDSTKRLYDVLKNERLSYYKMLDLPIESNGCSVIKLKNDLLSLVRELEIMYKKPFSSREFINAFRNDTIVFPNSNFVLLLGARSNASLLNAVRPIFDVPVIDMTCANNRSVLSDGMSVDDPIDVLMGKYAKALLSQIPCMRMADLQSRRFFLEQENCIGIIYHTIKFCDYYDYEYSKLKDGGIPILKIETDFTSQSGGQISTRIEGFAEAIRGSGKNNMSINKNGKYYAGIDSGSTSTELVILDSDKNIIKSIMVRTGANAGTGAKKALEQSDVKIEDIKAIVATGYGRKNIDFADSSVTEITCHAKGAKYLFPRVKTIIDIGGQDSKVISLDEKGNIVNFAMNDKCAAGTGRFLENMAKVLEIDMNTMANKGLEYKKDLTISSMCTVFAESEVVSLIAENHDIADIIHGLNKSVAVKTKALARNAAKDGAVMMTGGVANNKGVVKELEKQLETKIYISDKPEFCGALGAALIAMEE